MTEESTCDNCCALTEKAARLEKAEEEIERLKKLLEEERRARFLSDVLATDCEHDRKRRIEAEARADVDAKAKAALEYLLNERSQLWLESVACIDEVRSLLDSNGCDCECDCASEDERHGQDCDPCLACRISWAINS
jgi:hypothetical protein